jgi:uncharacterized membrane protein
MAVTMMLMLLGLITILGLVEVSYLYWAKRDAQKVADLAALSGAQQLSGPSCPAGSAAYAAASGNASDNGGTSANGYTSIDISCGRQPTAGSDVLAPASASSVAAIKVVASRDVNHIWGMAWKATFPVKAEAVAINNSPIAAFSVSPTLLRLDPSSPLNQLLDNLLGTSASTQVISSSGITNANISLLGLKNAMNLDAGTVSQLLGTKITLEQFIDAYVQTLSQNSDTSNIDLSALNTLAAGIKAKLGTLQMSLGDILNINTDTSDPDSALNTNVNALDILGAAVLAADSDNAVAIPAITVDVPDVANIDVMLSVIEPPQIGIGGVGTTAHSAQIRLSLNVSATNLLSNGDKLLALPLYLEIARVDGTIHSIECNVPASNGTTEDNVTINTDAGVLNAFLGTLPTDAFTNTHTSWTSLIGEGQPVALANVSIFGIGLVQVTAESSVNLATNPTDSLDFSVDPAVPISQQPNMSQTVGTSSSSVLETIVGSLFGSSTLNAKAKVLGGVLTVDAAPLLSSLSKALQPVLQPLDGMLLAPLLQTTGLSIGIAQVNLLSVNCNAGAQLVY